MVVIAAGCSFRTPSGAQDQIDAPGGDDGSTHGDSGLPDQLGCWPRWHDHSIRFTTPGPSGVFDSRGGGSVDRDPSLADDLTLYFSSQRIQNTSADLFVATRTSIDMPFGAAIVPPHFSNIERSFGDSKVSVSPDGLRVTLAGLNGGDSDILESTRTTTSDDFGTPSTDGFSNVNDFSEQYDPSLTANGLKMYYAPVLSSGLQVISSTTRAALDGEFADPVAEPGLESTQDRGDPWPSPDQTVIVFSSRVNGTSDVDVYYAVRDAAGDPWKDVTHIPDVNSNANEGDPVLTSDGCQILFASDRGHSTFSYTILMATAKDDGS